MKNIHYKPRLTKNEPAEEDCPSEFLGHEFVHFYLQAHVEVIVSTKTIIITTMVMIKDKLLREVQGVKI